MDANTDLNISGNGAFVESLKRNNQKIREDRAIAIAEDAQLIYKREVEDLEIQIKRLTVWFWRRILIPKILWLKTLQLGCKLEIWKSNWKLPEKDTIIYSGKIYGIYSLFRGQ